MDEIEYQVVSEAPVEAIVALYEAGGWWQESPQWRAVIPQMIRGSFCFMVARSRDGRFVGMGRAISDGVSDAYIQDVVVLKEMRKRGIGRELVKRLAEYCAERGIGWIGLVAEPGTEAFYESIGFRALEGFKPMLYGTQRER
ncbi:MAG: GNAT family N-acetyltransferase [Myxococcales bacterium]|jgi:ribosomal protein S18 acetylase RimI-like enzyme